MRRRRGLKIKGLYIVIVVKIKDTSVRLQVNAKDYNDAKLITINEKVPSDTDIEAFLFKQALRLFKEDPSKYSLSNSN